jgi:hypothetical protein
VAARPAASAAANDFRAAWNKTQSDVISIIRTRPAHDVQAAFTLIANRSCVSMIAPSLCQVVGSYSVSICCGPDKCQMPGVFLRQLLIFE